ncbi:MAG TPA: hypothetical protein VES65_06095 [Solirubrobacteraceae bacterium]|nr:hypothetical protein [Solirubrobacteraceae bacterium]
MTPADRTDAPRSLPRSDLLLVGLLIAGVTFLYALYALRVGSFQNDEELYLLLARNLARHFPSALWQSGIYLRGTQRLDPIILALPFSLLRGPGAYRVGHVIQALLFASTALPVFLLARQAKLPRSASMLATTLVLFVPWAVVSTSFLNESVAYPAYAWVLYTAWLAAAQPSTRHEILAILALVLAALSRTALLAMTPILPLAVLWQEWRWELKGKGWIRRARELPRRLCSRHPVVSAVIALAILMFISNRMGLPPGRNVNALAGSYLVPHIGPLSELLPRYRYYLARMAAGTSFLAFALGLWWVLATLTRPRDGARHALSVVCALGVAGVLLSLLQAGADERYVLYAAVPISLALTAALASSIQAGRISLGTALGVVGSALVVVLLIDSVSWPPLGGPYDFFTYPAATFYQRILILHAATVHLPFLHPAPERLVEIAIMIGAAAWVLAARFARAVRPAAVLLGIGLIALGATQLVYSMEKFTASSVISGPDMAELSWVDRHVPDGASVGTLSVSRSETLSYVPIWRVTEFWNTSVKVAAFFGPGSGPGGMWLALGMEVVKLTIQNETGLLSGNNGRPGAKVPDYLLMANQGTNRLGLDGKSIVQDQILPLELIHLSRPARIAWSLAGTTNEGFLASGQPATATIYSGALVGSEPHCATFRLMAPPYFRGRWPYLVISGSKTRRGSLTASQLSTISVPLHARMGRNGVFATFSVRVHGQVAAGNGSYVSAMIDSFSVGACPTRQPALFRTQPRRRVGRA